VKLSSISLCKDKHANEYFKHNNKMIPLRHLAPEILQSTSFSTATDVFACGMTIWEVINRGALPFASVANDELLQMLQNKSIDYGTLFENDKLPKLKKTLVSGIIQQFFSSIVDDDCLSTARLLVRHTERPSKARGSHQVARRFVVERKR